MYFVNYEDFLKTPNALSVEAAAKVYQNIMDSHPEKDVELSNLVSVMITRAIAYAEFRSKWLLMTTQEQLEVDETRSRHHDLFISSINKLSICMYQKGFSNGWEDELGTDRKRIGDLACYIAYVYSVNAR